MEPNQTVVETVVVLEYEPFVKNPICDLLRAYGYRVTANGIIFDCGSPKMHLELRPTFPHR